MPPFNYERTYRHKPCRYGCGALVPTKAAAKACEACRQANMSDRLARHYRDLLPSEIEARFEAALKQIRRQPREPMELYRDSTLHGLKARD